MSIQDILKSCEEIKEEAKACESPVALMNYVIELQGYLHYCGTLYSESVKGYDNRHAERKVTYSRIFMEYKTGERKETGIEKVTDGIATELATKSIGMDYANEAEAHGLQEQYKCVREDILELMQAIKKKADIILQTSNKGA